MKRLFVGTSATNGGMPLVQNDLKLIQDSIAQAVAGGLALNNQTTYILSGCDTVSLGGTLIGYNAGKIILNGEVCDVDANATGIDISINPLSTWYWTTVVTYDPIGLKVFASGATIDTYQITKAVIGYSSTPPAGAVMFSAVKTQQQIVGDIVAPLIERYTKTQSCST